MRTHPRLRPLPSGLGGFAPTPTMRAVRARLEASDDEPARRPALTGIAMTATQEWSVAVDCHDVLGEGPWWDARAAILLWVDIEGRRLHRHDPVSGVTDTTVLPAMASAVVARAAGGLALAMEDGIRVTEPGTAGTDDARLFAPLEEGDPSMRMNDACCDRAGRLWVGSIAKHTRPGAGSLYRVDPDGSVTRVLRDLSIANGIDWSPDDRRMYFIDSETRRVDVLDYDLATGQASGRRPLVTIPDDAGLPDGMTVDSEGCLWMATWDGWSLRRYRPSGELDRIVRLPVARVTSCAFGGQDLGDLYVTSASTGLSEAELRAQPLAGALFVLRSGARGLRATPFGG
jgi:sugar lactone lactonase YvrE